MATSQVTEALRAMAASIPLLILFACGQTVVLQDDEGAFRLSYGCESFESRARSTSEVALVRSYAIKAVSYANQTGDIDPVRAMMAADAEGDTEELERLVVEYLCGGGALAEPLNTDPSETANTGESRATAGFREGELELGSLAPSFRLPVLGQRYFDQTPEFMSLSDMAGSYVLITFGGPSCSPCVAEHHDLMTIWTRFRDRGFSVVSILYDTPERGWEWLKPMAPQSFPMLVDEGFEVAKKYGVRGIPRTYLVGPSGDVVQTWLGWTSMRSEELSRALDGLLPPLESRSR